MRRKNLPSEIASRRFVSKNRKIMSLKTGHKGKEYR